MAGTQQNPQQATLSNLPIDNGHTVRVVATTLDEEATAMVTWLLFSIPPQPSEYEFRLPHQRISKCTCIPSPHVADAYMQITSTLYKVGNGTYYIDVEYYCYPCQDYKIREGVTPLWGSISLTITFSWTQGGSIETRSRTIASDKASLKGSEQMYLPSTAQDIYVTATMDAKCLVSGANFPHESTCTCHLGG